MEENEEYELIVSDISHGELLKRDLKRYEDYMNTTSSWLSRHNKYLFADELLKRFPSANNIDDILEQNKKTFRASGLMVKRGEQREQIYYDFFGNYSIDQVSDPFFPFFFACKLSHVDILSLDNFLDYHLQHSFENNKERFFRFLNLTLRRYNHLIDGDTLQTTQEWVQIKEKEPLPLEETEEKEISIKGRMQRDQAIN